MQTVWAIVLGVIVGTVAEYVMPSKGVRGFALAIPLGVAGGVAATFFSRVLGFSRPGSFTVTGLVASAVGAMLVVFVYRLLVADRRMA